MTIGNQFSVLRRQDGVDGELIGSGLLIQPRIVQLDGQAAALLRTTPHQADQLELRVDGVGASRAVQRIRPGLLSYAETSQIVAANVPGITLLPVDGDLVFLEIAADDDDDDDDDCVGDPWWCVVVCTSSCTC
ncbi:hypothetical protein [Microlunatus soli]|uniref:Uncharacterized protein n=1 Tax=Microlunatus soli TaxID=630515 RepID=A0A1H1VSR6_9ACTN|nr:hypothetical protein [Microlunatus soli]SDS87521.1 hypothetical protein SAMN04489812_3327 [Microlunatus soli]